MNYDIACVIVTFNRKELLKRCLDAVISQTYKPKTVYITDNASTDGTMNSVKEWGYYNSIREGISFKYILNSKNEGGAGGFYLGMKTANEDTMYDALWIMDDDGAPEKDCLKHLVIHLSTNEYIAPVVLSDEDKESCSFTDTHESYSKFVEKAEYDIIKGKASPFNGILLSNKLLKKVGYPKKDMFIWGDENNFQTRCIIAGFPPITDVKAIHYHPVDRLVRFKYHGVNVSPIMQDWKLYCYVRNRIYNGIYVSPHKMNNKILIFLATIYMCLYSIWVMFCIAIYYKKELKQSKSSVIFKAGFSGMVCYFGGLDEYMKK